MVDVSKENVAKLNEIGLPVYLEDFLDSKSEIPCLSYREYSNVAQQEGDTFGYSSITYHIKVWAKSIQELIKYSCEVDQKMREMGYKRTNKAPDLWLDGIGQRDMKFSGLCREDFVNGGN